MNSLYNPGAAVMKGGENETSLEDWLSFIFSFEKAQDYTNYYPKYNKSLVIEAYIESQEKSMK